MIFFSTLRIKGIKFLKSRLIAHILCQLNYVILATIRILIRRITIMTMALWERMGYVSPIETKIHSFIRNETKCVALE